MTIDNKPKSIVIGGSAGSFELLGEIISSLRAEIDFSVFVVVHLPPDKKSLMAGLLNEKSKVKVIEVDDKQRIEPGYVYIAPPDYHMMVEKNNRISLSVEEPVLFSRPSIDVLFETAADACGEKLVGIVLSGANADGANGLKSIFEKGGRVIVQDPKEASAKAMPKAAIKSVPKAEVLKVKDIIKALSDI